MPDVAKHVNSSATPPANRHERMVNAAVWLASHGAWVGWGEVSDGKAVARKWKSDMTPDVAMIPRNLAGARNAVIVPAGRLVVIDVDREGWYERLKEAGLPDTFTVMSPTVREGIDGTTYRGVHVYLLAPDGFDVTQIPGTWQGGETRRSAQTPPEQSMVLGPWSLRSDGIYEPIPGSPRIIAEAPVEVLDWLIAHPRSKPLLTVTGDKDGDWVWNADMGSRHDHLRDKIRFWRGAGIVGQNLRDMVGAYMDKHAIPVEHDGRVIDRDEIERMCAGAETKYEDDPPKPVLTVVRDEDTGESVVIDPLLVEVSTGTPDPMILQGPDAPMLPIGLAMLLDHYRPLCDAPFSSLSLATLVTMSALFGPTPSLRWRGRHRVALFGALVGPSGYGRKGTTMRVVERALVQVDPILDEITTGGMASGEVFVDILNDSKKSAIGSVLISEHELMQVLILASREGSTLSGNLRKAWDGDRVETRSRKSGPSIATGYNAALIGGTTPAELTKRLSSDDLANGWAGRFLWFWSERHKRPMDPVADDTIPPGLATYLRNCIEHARTLGGSMLIRPEYTMRLDPEADARLVTLAEQLDHPPVGTLGAVQQRMLPNVVRLAMNAALLDQESVVSVDHVRFGEAMAGYAMRSLRAVFGLRVDDPVAMLILSVLAQVPGGWINTTDLRKAVGGRDYSRLQTALRVLMDAGLVEVESRPARGKGGQPQVGYRRVTGA